VVLVAFGGVLAGCGGDDEAASVPAERKAAVAERYADLVYAAYGASAASAEQLRERIDGFLARPTQARLRGARKAWIDARDDYVVTEPFRFYGGPIDDPKTGPEGLINAWPMDEAYVDYVAGDPHAGIVNDRTTYPKITEEVIVESNEKGGETNISSGWHAIEFLLWGQDRAKNGPGARPLSDYTTAPNARRRAAYLRLTTDRLVSDLRSVRAPWAPDGAFRKTFLGDLDSALRKIFRGIGALSSHELAGERMAVAFESKDQEDEHSCFSDNTNADVVDDLRGIRAVYNGAAPDDDGAPNRASVAALVMEADPALGEKLGKALDGSLAKAQAFPATFETMIAAPSGSPANRAIEQTIAAIEAQSELLKQAAARLDVKVGFEG
jgi:putative iron-regulated protein